MEFEGRFWVTGQDETAQPGVLRVAPEAPPQLEVEGELTETWRVLRSDEGVEVRGLALPEQYTGLLTVHGQDGHGRPLTLTESFTSQRTNERQRLQGVHAIAGGHIAGPRDHVFTGFRARLSHLEAWHRLLLRSGRSSAHDIAGGGLLTIQVAGEPQQVWLTAQEIPPASLRGIGQSFLVPLRTLFTLAADQSCDLLDLQVQESPDGEWWDVYSPALKLEPSAEPAVHEWLLQAVDLGLENLVAWLANVELLGPLPPAVASLGRAGAISLETEVLMATTLAEGLHRRLFPNERRFQDSELARRARQAAVDAVAAAAREAVSAVRGLLGHLEEPGFRTRLKQLAEAAGEAVPGVTGNTSKWKEIVYSARNEFAHRTTGFIGDDEDEIDRYLTVAFSLRWLLQGLLLINAEIQQSTLARRFEHHQPYQIFLEQAQYWQPSVYGVPTAR